MATVSPFRVSGWRLVSGAARMRPPNLCLLGHRQTV